MKEEEYDLKRLVSSYIGVKKDNSREEFALLCLFSRRRSENGARRSNQGTRDFESGRKRETGGVWRTKESKQGKGVKSAANCINFLLYRVNGHRYRRRV